MTERTRRSHGSEVREFTIHAIEADVVMNRFGLHVPGGAMYVLDEHLDAVRAVRDAIDEYHRAVEPPFRAAQGVLREHDGSAEALRRGLRDALHAYGGSDAAVRMDHVPVEYRDEVADAYREALDGLRAVVDGEYGTVEGIREAVGEATADYREAVPTQLNPLDDAFAMLEADTRKEPSLLQPLVIRANEGDTIAIEFVNHLDRHTSIHQTALPYDVETSDGMAVGRNPDTTAAPESAAPDNRVEYTWQATHQGTHFFYDGANQAIDSASDRPQKANLLARGLFGAVVVEPEGATWADPRTRDYDEAYRSGVRAVVHDPTRFETEYREFVVFYHSPVGVTPDVTWPASDREQSQHAINYRCDPTGQRVHDDEECPDCDTEKLFYHSWTNGDPGGGDSVYTAYKGDPIEFCFVGASHEENHVHHLHQHRYKELPRTDAATVDAQTIGLGDTYDAFLVAGHGPGTVRPDTSFGEAFRGAGAGYTHGTAGDILFHCHLFPHYAEGMWGFMRVLDKEHEFLEPLERTEICSEGDLEAHPVDNPLPLPSGTLIGADADPEQYPHFPAFVGDAIEAQHGVDDPVGYGAPEPPNASVDTPREPTEMERAALGEEILLGAPYRDPVEDPERIVEYTIAVMPAEIAYNDAGEHDPDGVVYVLEEANVSPGPGRSETETVGVTDGPVTVRDAERVRSGEMNPEPLFLRANVGDRVDVRLRNELDTVEVVEEQPFDASIHPHYVGYDVLGSDSLPNGFNYYQGTSPGETHVSCWYADEQGTIYFHDHIFAIKQGVHGMFCGLVVEPAGSAWRDPHSGNPVYSGAQADVITPEDADTPDFREQALHYHDFAPLVNPPQDRDAGGHGAESDDAAGGVTDSGEAGDRGRAGRNGDGPERDDGKRWVNPESEHTVNKGTMAINYRNAPYYNRDSEDSAYIHSSAVHGDPPTPTLEAYAGDTLRFRVFQGCYEEQHTFSVHGLRTERELVPTQDSVSKYLGTSEAFTFEVAGEETDREGFELSNPDGLPVADYRYGSNVVDDLWTGMWGLVRLWGGEVDHLVPLADADPPGETFSQDALREMGHPAPYSDVDWTDEGQRAKRLYTLEDEESLFGGVVDILDDVGDTLLGEIDTGDLGRDVQHLLRDHGVYDTPLIPADANARRNESVGETPPTPVADDAEPGHPGPDDADVREYDVTAFVTEISYNDYGDHDPHGIVFALDRYVEEIEAGDREPEPLTLRANEGERLVVNLTNDLPRWLDNDHDHPEVLVPREWERSARISLHPLELQYDVQAANGSTVGFNYDTTVPPATPDDPENTLTYEWYADGAVNAVCLWDMADLRSTRHHGAYSQVFVEPADAVALTPDTAEPAVGGSSAMVTTPSGSADFREHGLLFADSQYVFNRFDPRDCVVPRPDEHVDGDADPPSCTQVPEDTEDQGYGSVNYRSEPFARRFETNDAQHLAFSSTVHGDPNTPVPEAIRGDPVRFRVGCAGDKARAITFHLAGHQWERFQGVDGSPVVGVDGQFGPGTAKTLPLLGGAGGPDRSGGDFLYQETKQRRRLESGLWGIFRVHNEEPGSSERSAANGSVHPLPDRAADVPLADRPGFVVRTGDVTESGDTDVVVGVPDSDIGAVDAGAVYVFVDTPPERITDLSSADLQIPNETADERAGTDVTLTGRTDDGTDDIVVETATERIVTVRGGRSLRDLIDSPSSSAVAEFVRKSATTDVTSIVPLKEAGDG